MSISPGQSGFATPPIDTTIRPLTMRELMDRDQAAYYDPVSGFAVEAGYQPKEDDQFGFLLVGIFDDRPVMTDALAQFSSQQVTFRFPTTKAPRVKNGDIFVINAKGYRVKNVDLDGATGDTTCSLTEEENPHG